MSRVHQHPINGINGTNGKATSRLVLSIILNLAITLAEIAGGLLSGSLSLLSDAMHNFSDTTSLGISLAAVKISARSPDRQRTFGYRRAQIIGALVNLILLVLVGFYLITEAIQRYFNPQPIQGGVMLIVAVVGLLANLGTAALLHNQSKGNLNVRSAFVHVLGDAFSSVGVVVAGVLIIRFQLYLADTLLTLLISAYILVHSGLLLRQTVNILMQGVPEGMDIDKIVAAVKSIDEVQDIHHIHIWQLDETQSNLEAHIVIDQEKMDDMTCIKQAIRERLARSFNITHSTLEFEFEDCENHLVESCYEVDRVDY